MRFVKVILLTLSIIFIWADSGQATQYVNRKLITCEPLIYEVEPIDIYGGSFKLDRSYRNDYGDCTGQIPGPPFVIELPVTIENTYNTDGSVAEFGYFEVDNQWGGGDPFEIIIYDGAYLKVNGNIVAKGKPGDPIIFNCEGRFYSDFQGGPLPPYSEFTFDFSYCEFYVYPPLNSPTLEMYGGHLKLDNCTFGPTDDQQGLYYIGMHDGFWDVSITNCMFNGTSPAYGSSANILNSIGSLKLNNNHFTNCLYTTETPSTGVLEVQGNMTLKELVGNSGSSNSRNNVVFNSAGVYIEDSCVIKNSKDLGAFFLGSIIVDTNATLIVDKGSVLQMRPHYGINVRGEMVVDSAVVTGLADGVYGLYMSGNSSYEPGELYAWDGIDTEIGSRLTFKNNSRLRWTYGPIEGEGSVTIDHSVIEQCWGSAVGLHYTSPCSLQVTGSTIWQNYGGEGIEFVMSINPLDSASGYLAVDSSTITTCVGDGIYLGGGAGRPLDDDLNVRITNSNISGNGGGGISGFLAAPTDSIVIMNNRLIGNGFVGFWIEDNGCDSMHVRLETNAAVGNAGTGLGVETGFLDAVGNTSAHNENYGLYYPYKPRRPGLVANNVLAYNDNYGLYCYTRYGGILPAIAHNVFWQNNVADSQLYIYSDDFRIYTVDSLQALGGVGLTNEEFSPAFKPTYRDVIKTFRYDSVAVQTHVWVNGDSLQPGQLNGLAILPSHRDTTAWFYVVDNTTDTICIAGDIRSAANVSDTLTVFEYHLTPFSPAVDFGDNDYVTSQNDIDGDARIIDSDENGSELVDAGADEFDPDTTNITILVVSPPPDTTVVPGDTLILSWFTTGIASVNVDYTIDLPLGGEPVEWLEVARDLSTLVPLYFWEVPAVQSARCLIRVSDASNPGYSKTSEIFHIKQPRLTRFAADSTYDFFKPSAHGWSFINSIPIIWPQSWWQQYDYLTGQDPYTGQVYPSFDTAYAFGTMQPSVFPSWPIFVETFGQGQCYNNTPMGLMYLMRAVNRWADIARAFGGSCAGMCSSALLAFGSKSALDVQWGYLGLTDSSFQKPLTDDLREFILIMHNHLNGKQQEQWQAQHYEVNVDSTVKLIRQMLLSGDRSNDAFLTIGNQTATSSHAVVPYAVLDDPDPNKVQVYIYDPNSPGTNTLYIEADTVANVWSCSAYPTWGGTWYFFLHYPVRWSLDTPEMKALARRHAALPSDSVTGIELLYPSGGHLTVYDNAGDSVGFNATGLFNEIEGAAPLLCLDSSHNFPQGFLLPDQAYDITLSALTDSVVRIGFYYDSLYIGYSRLETDSGQTDSLVLNGDLAVYNPDDGDSKAVQLRMARTLEDSERTIMVGNLQLETDASVKLEPMGTAGWYLSNPGQARMYQLWLRQVSSEGEKKFFCREVSIGADQSHILTPDWTTLNPDSCTIYIDYDFDMLADDSAMLHGDILVGVEDTPNTPLPYSFELSQNYPNPFNPVTTIEYSIPRQSHVNIDVYNMLGQKIRALVDQEESAGSYTITWDGTNSDGSAVATGIYLYRFQAGDYVQTKKMLLMK